MSGDDTLGGYAQVHRRPPAFGGKDGLAYSVAAFADPSPDAAGRFGAALLFVRWAGGADRPVGHLETGYLAPLLAMPLSEVKAHLDGCIDAAGEGAGEGGRGNREG
jgi:hypothetical protein